MKGSEPAPATRFTRDELESLEKGSLVDIILSQGAELAKLQDLIRKLKARLDTNSGNSSVPPSADSILLEFLAAPAGAWIVPSRLAPGCTGRRRRAGHFRARDAADSCGNAGLRVALHLEFLVRQGWLFPLVVLPMQVS